MVSPLQVGMFLGMVVLLAGCARLPKDVPVVQDLDVTQYLGRWYEIARLDHWFERGMTDVTADYTTNANGTIRVVNRGYLPSKQEWKEAVGKARFVKEPNVGRLKVSFFGPFYGGYNIIDLDRADYSHALICGNNRSYLWILARQPSLPPLTLRRLLEHADALGFQTNALIFVSQDQTTNTLKTTAATPAGETVEILEAVVRAFSLTRQKNEILFLSLADAEWEPLADFVQRFDAAPFSVRSVSQAKIAGPWALDRDTGERGVVLYLNSISSQEPGVVQVDCSWHEGFGEDAPPSSDSICYEVRRDQGRWLVSRD